MTERVADPAELGARREPQLARRLDPQLGAAQQLLHQAGDVTLEPRHGRELDRVGDLVQRHPGHELLLVGAEVA